MPIYLFEHPDTKQIVEVLQKMNDEHIYEKDGIKYQRVMTVPRAAMDTQIDPFSSKQFLDKTRNLKGGTVGHLWDLSKELSEKRIQKTGHDSIKEKVVGEYKKKTKKSHPLAHQ